MKTSAKTKPNRADSKALKARELAGKIVQICRLPKLDLDKAAKILGSRLGPRRDPNEARAEWSLQPTPLFVEARAGVIHGTDIYMSIVPHPSLGLAFEDFVPLLLDASYMMRVQRSHPWEDSLATMVESIQHLFRVEVGELMIEVPSTLPKEASNQEEKAIYQGIHAGKGSSAHRNRVRAVHFGIEVKEDWRQPQTLREFRERREALIK